MYWHTLKSIKAFRRTRVDSATPPLSHYPSQIHSSSPVIHSDSPVIHGRFTKGSQKIHTRFTRGSHSSRGSLSHSLARPRTLGFILTLRLCLPIGLPLHKQLLEGPLLGFHPTHMSQSNAPIKIANRAGWARAPWRRCNKVLPVEQPASAAKIERIDIHIDRCKKPHVLPGPPRRGRDGLLRANQVCQ